MSAVAANLNQIKADIALAQAAADTAGVGNNQSWQDFTPSRALNVTYTNTSGKEIEVSISATMSGGNNQLVVDGQTVSDEGASAGTMDNITHTAVIPKNSYYYCTSLGGLISWKELR